MLNRPAPVFVRSGPGGARVDLAQDRGRVVLLNFWATWCAPCRTEMPRFAAWQKEYGPRGLRVVGVSIDDSEPPVRAFLEKLPVDYPVVMGDRALAEQYGGVLGVPVTFLIDRRGIIRGRFEGETDLRALETRMRRLLDSGSP
ncbi:MAG TPA: TlpA disulfide reductase family protein [Acidobacteriaceae bacterium]|nr:TlpA disulfide reductase family protein [Acidobacteriaceae bacterium]